jgi:WD40 repeat protein
LVSASQDETVRVWDVNRAEEVRQVKCKGIPALSPDGETLAYADKEFITLWSTETGNEQLKVPKHSPGTGALAFSPDGKTLVSICDLSIDLWDMEDKANETRGSLNKPSSR